MGEKKQVKKFQHIIFMNIVWSMLSVIINYLMNFLITPYVTNHIGVEAYGYVSLANTMISYVDIISISLNAFAGRFISIAYHQGEREKANRYFSSTIFADFVLGVGVSAIGLVVICNLTPLFKVPGALLADVRLLFIIVLCRYLLIIMRTAFDTAAFIAERVDITEKLQSIAYLLQAGVLLSLCLFCKPHVWYVGAAAAAAALFLLSANMVVCHRLTPDLQFRWKDWSGKAIWEIICAGMWTSLNNLGNVLNSGLDLLITNIMLNATVLGEISVAKNLATITGVVILKISAAFRPRQLILFSKGDTEQMVKLFRTTMKLTGTFCGLLITGFYVCGTDFLSLWLPGQNIGFIFRASMIVLLSDIAVGVVHPLYYTYTLTKKLKVPCMITILMGTTNVVSMYLLIRHTSLGVYAVLLTTLVINLVHFVDAPLYAAHCLHVPFRTFYPVIFRHLSMIALGMGAAHLLRNALPAATSWVGLAGKCAGTGVVLLPVLLLIMFRVSELKNLKLRR